ncbi:MAG: TonB-dependent receptor [Sphingomonadaceae bacterium]
MGGLPAIAETAPADIIVTGQGLPQPPGARAYGSVVIGQEQLRNSPSGRLDAVLESVAGFQQFRRSDSRASNPTAQGATLRSLGGNASSRTLVLIDGVPVADPFFGNIPFAALTPGRLSAVRITRGSGAGPFGAGALAGTIELMSASGADLPLLSASALGGSRDASEISASFNPHLGAGTLSLSGRWDRGDGFYTTPEDQRGPADVRARYESWSTSLNAVVPLSAQTEIQVRGLIWRDDRTLRFAGADNSIEGQDASIRLVSRGDWQIDALAYLQTRDFTNIVVSATSFRPVLDQRATPATGYGGKFELRPPVGGDHVLRLGADLRANSGTMFENAISGMTGLVTARRRAGGDSSTIGMFIEDDWALGDVVLTAGGRLDHWRIDGGHFTEHAADGTLRQDQRFADRSGWRANGRLGALWRPADAITLRAAGYTGFRMPTLNELYRPFTVFPVTTQANAELGLERLRGVEAGVEYAPINGTRLAATLFHNRLSGAIANVTIGRNLRERRNVDAIIAKGVELTAESRLGALLLAASYAYSHSAVKGAGIFADLDGMTPSQSPRHIAAGSIGWSGPGGLHLTAHGRYVGKQYEDDRETDVLPDAFTLGATAGLPLGGGLSLFGRVENLFDADVITRNAGGSIDLGAPRTLWLGLRFN